jgi:hypothetical protein
LVIKVIPQSELLRTVNQTAVHLLEELNLCLVMMTPFRAGEAGLTNRPERENPEKMRAEL